MEETDFLAKLTKINHLSRNNLVLLSKDYRKSRVQKAKLG